MTPWERKLWHLFLKNHDIKFYRQRPIKGYIVDFFCRDAMLAIELDGSGHYEEEQIIYDQERTRVLNGLGINVLRFSNREIDTQFYEVCSVIDEYVRKHTF